MIHHCLVSLLYVLHYPMYWLCDCHLHKSVIQQLLLALIVKCICGLIAPSHRNMAERIKENALYGKLRHYY